ncbi:MAG: DUF1080 domain-containing protein [Planctomycetota bacterium]|nr:MAG: DUF1080 domain-containing protein [Planctomycetota bacterium]
MRRLVLLLALLPAACVAPRGAGSAGGLEPGPDGWIPLFNGRDLTGWTPKIAGLPLGEDPLATFRVEDGLLKVRYDRYAGDFAGRFGHLFHDREWSHYRMRVEYRFVGDQAPGAPGWAFRNSGVMIHGQPAATLRLDQPFPVSIEVQLLGGDGEHPRPTANLCTPGTNVVMDGELVTRHCTDSTSPTFSGDQWVTIEFEVHGAGRIRHFVGGREVLSYEQPQLDPNDPDARSLIRDGRLLLDHGTISLQAEGHPLDFRRVEILPLDCPTDCRG